MSAPTITTQPQQISAPIALRPGVVVPFRGKALAILLGLTSVVHGCGDVVADERIQALRNRLDAAAQDGPRPTDTNNSEQPVQPDVGPVADASDGAADVVVTPDVTGNDVSDVNDVPVAVDASDVPVIIDADTPTPPRDIPGDNPVDAGVDTGNDAGTDTGVDTGTDGPRDVTDVGMPPIDVVSTTCRLGTVEINSGRPVNLAVTDIRNVPVRIPVTNCAALSGRALRIGMTDGLTSDNSQTVTVGTLGSGESRIDGRLNMMAFNTANGTRVNVTTEMVDGVQGVGMTTVDRVAPMGRIVRIGGTGAGTSFSTEVQIIPPSPDNLSLIFFTNASGSTVLLSRGNMAQTCTLGGAPCPDTVSTDGGVSRAQSCAVDHSSGAFPMVPRFGCDFSSRVFTYTPDATRGTMFINLTRGETDELRGVMRTMAISSCYVRVYFSDATGNSSFAQFGPVEMTL
ncbi:MAG: hypothetical protein HY817_00415 [Candidatus Abawacabacteria bacterium]|nr:hypothetical protein [Candidatus Abawacabacteria bacterium]